MSPDRSNRRFRKLQAAVARAIADGALLATIGSLGLLQLGARRDDEQFCHVSVWEHQGEDKPPLLHKEPLSFDAVHLATRSYK